MKKLLIIAICMVGMMMACTNKGNTAPGDGNDSDSVANDSLALLEEVDTTPQPMFIYMMNAKNMMMCYWNDEDSLQQNFSRNRALYTKLLNNNKCLGIKYIGEQLKNPDGGEASYGQLHGREQIPAAGLKYAFTDEKFKAGDMWGMYVAVTDEYLSSRKLIDMKHIDANKPLPADVIKKLEAEYKMKVKRSQLTAQGNKYGYGVLQFNGKYKTVKEGNEKYDKCLALEVVMAGDKVYSFPVEGYIIEGQPTWHADDDGEYYASNITLFEAPDDALEIAFVEGAPESITTGMFYIRDGKMTRQIYEIYQTMIDEELPLWKKDLAQLQKLYVADDRENKSFKLCKYRWLDLDGDGNQEVWLRAKDDKHGAFFTHEGDKWKLIATEDGHMTPSFLYDYSKSGVGYLVIAGSAGGPSVFTNYYEIKKSKVVNHLNILYVYGEIEECGLNGKEISHEAAQKLLNAMPKEDEIAVYWREFE